MLSVSRLYGIDDGMTEESNAVGRMRTDRGKLEYSEKKTIRATFLTINPTI
jgi:hypothetical protein